MSRRPVSKDDGEAEETGSPPFSCIIHSDPCPAESPVRDFLHANDVHDRQPDMTEK